MSFFFFTDPNLLISQKTHEAFGPNLIFNGNNNGYSSEKFNITSIHRYNPSSLIKNNPGVYAICDGIIYVTPIFNGGSIDPDFVNIILKPIEQPEFNCQPIKFYVYRNVLRSSFITGPLPSVEKNSIILNSDKLANDFTRSINDSTFPAGSNPTIYSLGLGKNCNSKIIDGEYPNLPGNTELIDLFSSLNPLGTLRNVKGGDRIGSFSNKFIDPFGFEILLDNIGFHPVLDDIWLKDLSDKDFSVSNLDLRCTYNRKIISVELPTTEETNAAKFIRKKKREEILNYLDPAAFFGNFVSVNTKENKFNLNKFPLGYYECLNEKTYKRSISNNTKISIKQNVNASTAKSYNVESKDNGTQYNFQYILPLYGDDIYIKILYGGYTEFKNIIFKNLNLVYLDIRNELNQSFNFNSNYIKYVDENNQNSIHSSPILEYGYLSLPSNNEVVYKPKKAYSSPLNVEPWPLIIIEYNNSENNVNPTIYNKINRLGIKLPKDVTLKEPEQSAYVHSEQLDLGSYQKRNKLLRQNNLLRLDLERDTMGELTGFVESIEFLLVGNNSSDDAHKYRTVANYIQITYVRHDTEYIDEINSMNLPRRTNTNPTPIFTPPSVANYIDDVNNIDVAKIKEGYKLPKKVEFLDNLWMPFDLIRRLPQNSAKLEKFVYNQLVYIDNTICSGEDFMGNIGIAKQSDGSITFFALANPGSFIKNKTKNSDLNVFDKSVEFVNPNLFYQEVTGSTDTKESYITNLARNSFNLGVYTKTEEFIEELSLDTTASIKVSSSNYSIDHIITFHIPNSQWQKLNKFYNENISNFVPGFEVFLAVKLDDVKYDQYKEPYQSYKLILRGYTQRSNDIYVSDFNTNIVVFAKKPTLNPQKYKFNIIGGTLDPTNFQVLGNSNSFNLQTTIYVLKGTDITPLQVNELATYAVKNIRDTWDTSTNKGLTATLRNSIPYLGIDETGCDENGITQPNQHYNISSNNIRIKILTPRHILDSKSGECFVIIRLGDRSIIPGREFALPAKKTMVFYWDFPKNIENIENSNGTRYKDNDEIDFTYAHEFGHLLGLVDRYTYISSYYSSSTNPFLQFEKIDNEDSKNIPIYLPDDDFNSLDSGYSREYRWLFNLYSGRVVNPNSILINEGSLSHLLDPKNNDGPMGNNLPDFYSNFDNTNFSFYSNNNKFSIFISRFQFDCIITLALKFNRNPSLIGEKNSVKLGGVIDYENSDFLNGNLSNYVYYNTQNMSNVFDYSNYILFKPNVSSLETNLNISFAGIKLSSGNLNIVSDANYIKLNNPLNQFDHKMENRIYDRTLPNPPDSTTDSLNSLFDGYLNITPLITSFGDHFLFELSLISGESIDNLVNFIKINLPRITSISDKNVLIIPIPDRNSINNLDFYQNSILDSNIIGKNIWNLKRNVSEKSFTFPDRTVFIRTTEKYVFDLTFTYTTEFVNRSHIVNFFKNEK
jgi:hypothetical protein